MTNQEFIKLIGEKIQSENAKRGNPIFSSVAIAQAILETGWGKSVLMMKANAIYGIKATTNWNGKVYNSKTNEVYDGKVYNIVACFRAYNNLEESIGDYFDLICGNYRKALATNSPLECIQEIKNGGYATDPQYVNKIMSIINTWNLTRFDNSTAINWTYQIGKNYKLKENLFVRTGAGTNYSIKSYDELSLDGKKHAFLQKSGVNAILKSGTIVTCLDVIINDRDIWLKIPSGYVAGLYKGERLIDVL